MIIEDSISDQEATCINNTSEIDFPEEIISENNHCSKIEQIEETTCNICDQKILVAESFIPDIDTKNCYKNLIHGTEFIDHSDIEIVCENCNKTLNMALKAKNSILASLSVRFNTTSEILQGNVEEESIPAKYIFYCPNCCKNYDNFEILQEHNCSVERKRSAKLKTTHCNHCYKIFTDRLMLAEHVKDNHPEKVFACGFCNSYYGNKKFLVQHMNELHSNIKKADCDKCGANFNTWHQVLNHICLSTKHMTQHRIQIKGIKILTASPIP